VLTIDTYIESFTGRNILGYGEEYGKRIVSFFKDEPIVGGYINAFYLIIIGYFFSLGLKSSTNYKYLIFVLSLFFLWAIILTGERSNAIKAIFGFIIFYSINNHFNIKEKLISILLVVLLIGSLINSSNFLKLRYKGQFLDPIYAMYKSKIKKKEDKENIGFGMYAKQYQSGYSVFKDYPIFGVGNKNYRLETCAKIIKQKYICNTHPHQIYFEFLAEHGLIGTIIILYILFNLIFGKLKIILQSKNYVQIGSFIFLFNLFIPLLPSGAFFTDYSLTVFWLVLSIMYSVNKKTNIFSKN